MAMAGTVKMALVIEIHPARVSFSFVIKSDLSFSSV
jgi:hypothetical protein